MIKHFALRGLSLGKFADANGQRPRRLFGGVPEDLYLHGFGREIKRMRRARGEFFGRRFFRWAVAIAGWELPDPLDRRKYGELPIPAD